MDRRVATRPVTGPGRLLARYPQLVIEDAASRDDLFNLALMCGLVSRTPIGALDRMLRAVDHPELREPS